MTLAGLVALALAASGAGSAGRLADVRAEIERLKTEAQRLAGREQGLLGELSGMDTAIALRRAELEEAELGLGATETALAARERSLAELEADQARRAPRLAERLRALYARGPVGRFESMWAAAGGAGRSDGVRYAGFLARRDAGQIALWRRAVARLHQESTALASDRETLAAARSQALRAGDELSRARRERSATIARVRDDRLQHDRAIAELEAAAADLSRVIAGSGPDPAPTPIDVRSFRGLLDWPADGPVSAGFGPMVHPRFKTQLPHPGLDIDAAEASPFRSVFDGRVVYAASLPGYGLTVVVDHGFDIVSVYAHASVLLIGAGDAVFRGQEIGRVGESGSLKGPYLYFEMREGGRPTDPAEWLRRR